MSEERDTLEAEIARLRKLLAERGEDSGRSNERYRAFVEHSTEAIWCCEFEEPVAIALPEDEQIHEFYQHGVLSEGNLALAHMYGFSAVEEMLHARLREFVPPGDPANIAYLRAFIRSGYRLNDAESHEIDKDGKPKFFLNNLTGVIEDGRLLRVWGTQRDMTERRQLEQQLRQSQKMEAVGRFAAGIAHDFNNLVSAVLGYTQLLLRDELPPTARQRVMEIEHAGDRAAALVRQLMGFGRQQIVQPTTLDLRDAIGDITDMLTHVIGPRVTLDVVRKPEPALVRADRGQIEQVVVNLVMNARDAMPQGGSVRLALGDAHLDEGEAQRAGVAAGPQVLLSVADTGVGMDAATKEHIFDPFFTTKDAGLGTGLGLSTVYGIVHQSGGHIAVDSKPGGGTTFRIYLPRVAESPAASA